MIEIKNNDANNIAIEKGSLKKTEKNNKKRLDIISG